MSHAWWRRTGPGAAVAWAQGVLAAGRQCRPSHAQCDASSRAWCTAAADQWHALAPDIHGQVTVAGCWQGRTPQHTQLATWGACSAMASQPVHRKCKFARHSCEKCKNVRNPIPWLALETLTPGRYACTRRRRCQGARITHGSVRLPQTNTSQHACYRALPSPPRSRAPRSHPEHRSSCRG